MLGSSSRVGEGPVGTVAEGVEGNAHGVQGLDFSVSADGVPELAHEPSRLGGGAYQRRQSRDQGEIATETSLVGEAAGGGGRGGAAIAPPDSRFDMNVVLLWLEQALPFLLILFCFFLREHLLEIGFFGERLHLSACALPSRR